MLVIYDLSTLVARDLSGFINCPVCGDIYETDRLVTGAQTHAIRTRL